MPIRDKSIKVGANVNRCRRAHRPFIACARLVILAAGCDHDLSGTRPDQGQPGSDGGQPTEEIAGSSGQAAGATGGSLSAAGGSSGSGGVGGSGGQVAPTFAYPLCQTEEETAGWFPADTGAPRSFGANDVAVVDESQCQPFSGCKTLRVYRNKNTNDLVLADVVNDVTTLSRFSDLTGIPMTLEPKCQLAQSCFPGGPETHHRLVVHGDEVVSLDAGTHAVINLNGQAYTVWFGVAVTVPDDSTAICTDAGDYWRGGLTTTVTR